MAELFAVAKYICEQQGEMSAMKLQKLMFYSQAWHLVWDEQPLFEEDFQAFANGPVVPELYWRHKGMFIVDSTLFSDVEGSLSRDERETVDKVLEFYGHKSAHFLSSLTHSEEPWLEARGDTPIGERSTAVISKASLAEYYGSL